MAAPAQNARPAPVSTTAASASSRSADHRASYRPWDSAWLRAFSLSGRFIVRTRTAPRSSLSNGSLIPHRTPVLDPSNKPRAAAGVKDGATAAGPLGLPASRRTMGAGAMVAERAYSRRGFTAGLGALLAAGASRNPAPPAPGPARPL